MAVDHVPPITVLDARSRALSAEYDIYQALDNDASLEGIEYLLGRYETERERLAAVESQHEREQPFAASCDGAATMRIQIGTRA